MEAKRGFFSSTLAKFTCRNGKYRGNVSNEKQDQAVFPEPVFSCLRSSAGRNTQSKIKQM